MMDLIKKALIVIASVYPYFAPAQEKIWYFGNQAGIDFTGTTPVAITNSNLNAIDYAAAISDLSGNLLFYTNGMEVMDKSHNIMQNGSGLMGQISNGQCALILQQPSSDLYYIFTVGQYNSFNGLRYHIVDMTLNGGFGEVISKNNLLLTPSTEKLDAVYDISTDSYWIVTHGWNSNNFYAYKLTAAGLNPVPVISSTGSVHSGGLLGNYNSMGQLCISPEKDKIICGVYSMGIFELFDFDIVTGMVFNPVTLTGFTNAWGAAFSPNGTKLYVTEWMQTNVIQMDITSGIDSTILSTSTVVGHGTGPGGSYQVGYLQLAPDQKIYGAVYGDDHLLVINNPNASGLLCNLVDEGFYLHGKTSSAGLCRSVRTRFVTTGIDELKSDGFISVYPNPFNHKITVSLDSETESLSEYNYCIYDIRGTAVKRGIFDFTNKGTIELDEISNGVYFIRVTSNKTREPYISKIIK